MITIKKWQDDLLGALVVMGSLAALRDAGWYWKLPCLAGVYLVDRYLSGYTQRTQAQAKAKVRASASGEISNWFMINGRWCLSSSSIYFMLEQSVCTFVASHGYSNVAAKLALDLINGSLFNGQYIKQQEKERADSADYNGEVNVLLSKPIMLLKKCMAQLILNSFEDGISKYPKILLSLSLLHFAHLYIVCYSHDGSVNKNQGIEITKRSLFSAVCTIPSVELSQLCNFDNLLLERITERVISSTMLLAAPLVL